MPRFDLMRNTIDGLRSRFSNDNKFLKAVSRAEYCTGYYADHAINYAKTLLDK